MVSLCIIAEDQVEAVKNIVEKYGKFFKEVLVAGDTRHDEFRQLPIKYFEYKWIDDFADKRNFLAGKVETPYYFRLDTDDEILGAENIPQMVERAKATDVDVVFCHYLYGFDDDGNCNAEHYRETLIKKTDKCEWNKKVHETLFWENQTDIRTVKDDSVQIKHNVEPDHALKSSKRNIQILLQEFKEDGENTDPRTIGYIGRSFLGLGDWQKAIFFLTKLIEKSGWAEDKYFAWCQISEAWLRLGDCDKSIDCALIALKQNPSYPDAYLKLGQAYLDQHKFKEALYWYKAGVEKPKPETLVVLDPAYYTYITWINVAMCFLGVGDCDKAIEWLNKAKAVSPSLPSVKTAEKMILAAKENNDFFYHLLSLLKVVNKDNPKKLKNIFDIIPDKFKKDERAFKLRAKFSTPVYNKGITFFCGAAYEDWADPSVSFGIGGSEEAVIYMSRELAKLGHQVTVYNQCGEMEGEYTGVTYRNYYEFNPNDEFETIIFWRGVPAEVKARKRIVWLHDVPMDTINDTNFNYVDEIFVLSEYHKSLLNPKYHSKAFVTRNGVNQQDVENLVLYGNFRKKNKLIYTSSYDRGLEHLLDMWADVKKEVPDAELHVFYGWNTYDKMVKLGYRTADFKERLLPKLKQEGVVDHGRVGQDELTRELLTSDFYVYPSHFEEISCISVLRAQLCGAIPITTDYAALAESNKFGIKVEGKANECKDKFKDVLISALKSEKRNREEMMANKSFAWSEVCREWLPHL
jgi:tetratricopeptide (TPR) repeat protein/glycosyltransferase involved in cell wall biosynthesis